MTKYFSVIVLCLLSEARAQEDTFNYRSTSGSDYGPEDWDEVSCNNLATCPGWPAKLLGSIGWRPSKNECRWCPIEGNSCGQHRQSPIDLYRDRAIPGHPEEKECPDWHWIQYLDGTCDWEDMADSFEIGRNALMIHTPLTNNGDIDCVNPKGERKFPKLDYSKGFPDWWYLSRTDIVVPSEHVQHGKRYAAEVKLSHFYEIDHYKNKLGIISFFMQDFEGEPSWPFLDKLICKWRQEEEKKREACGLPPAPVYKMCQLYRGQTRSTDDFEAPTQAVIVPTRAPLVSPPAIPIQNFGGDPEEFRFPLGLCQGDCDFSSHCANGLICDQRDAFEPVPGCIGGESDPTNTDYCIFDPYGPGYSVPTIAPTAFPTITNRPTLTPLPPQPLADFGGTPPANMFPLQLCQGDCDKDDDCAEGLICFQRTSNETVPGCLGGENDIEKTDYCIVNPFGPGYDLAFLPTASPITGTNPPGLTGIPTEGSSMVPLPTVSPTFVPRPTGEPIPLQNLGWEPPVPLPECAGDCDIDADCGPGLYCYQRNTVYQAVPGCTGGEEDPSLTDYCTYRPLATAAPDMSSPADTKQPTSAAPISKPTASPTDKPAPTIAPAADLPELNIVGWSPATPLNECEGDCDSNDDCAENLLCFQRNSANVAVPGCRGGSSDNTLTDYCIRDPDAVDDKTEDGGSGETVPSDTDSPTAKPTALLTQAPTDATPTTNSELPRIKDLGWTPPQEVRPLGRCEGDCDIRQDCGPGLDCYQRYLPNVAVPGCSGGEDDPSLTDYCVPEELINSIVPVTPTNVPVSPTQAPQSTNDPAPVSSTQAPQSTNDAAPFSPTQTPQSTKDPAPVPPTQVPQSTNDPAPVSPTQAPQSTNGPAPVSPTQAPQSTNGPTSVSPTSTQNSDAPVETRVDTNSTGLTAPAIPAPIECGSYVGVNFFRMCKSDSCCTDPRSTSAFCHESYRLLGDDVESACHHCCLEQQGEAKQAGPAAVVNPNIPKVLECDAVDQAMRMCRQDSCCDASGSNGAFCKEKYAQYSHEQIESICWYCCYPSKDVTFDTRRALEEAEEEPTVASVSADATSTMKQKKKHPIADSRAALKEMYRNQTIGENDRMTHDVNGKPVIVRAENFEEKGMMDEEAYFQELLASYKRRALQQTRAENYDDVHYWPYEWFLKVGTEYYFRYEGTQTVPPCYDTAHWRAFKDPIRVSPHQMRELERLIAWRQGDNCENDTAGKPTSNPNAVDVARPLQSYHSLHRLVFCECKNWPSKFIPDRQWCRNWQTKPAEERLVENPYNWPSDGFDFL